MNTSRFLRPELAAAAAAAAPPEPPAGAAPTPAAPKLPPTTGPAAMRFVPKKLGVPTVETPLATELVCAVAVVTTGLDMIGTCDTAKSGPDMPVVSKVVPCVSTP